MSYHLYCLECQAFLGECQGTGADDRTGRTVTCQSCDQHDDARRRPAAGERAPVERPRPLAWILRVLLF